MGRTATLDLHDLQIHLLKIHVLQIGLLQTHFLLIQSSRDFTICPVPGLRKDVFPAFTGQPEIRLRSQATQQPRPQGKEKTLETGLGRDKLKWYYDKKNSSFFSFFFSSFFERVFAYHLTGKILSFKFYPKAVYFEGKFWILRSAITHVQN